ncbi:hypothetical protein VKA52_14600 [Halobacillus sp. HZG1]|uniref:hypothetical protein n=1 Tax=Halobacillus sp. HZG1 TaxID=3111769 RepID=UPI002DBD741C|nr:hypothetical protein [Halobacillus sp. HZG1]MEC3884963.1 hypothetical protein [Halobacillus sp. HZG1]
MDNSEKRTCLKCGSEMTKCYVAEGFRGLLVKNPEGDRIFSNKKNTNINPVICTHCGFAEWYADEPENLI